MVSSLVIRLLFPAAFVLTSLGYLKLVTIVTDSVDRYGGYMGLRDIGLILLTAVGAAVSAGLLVLIWDGDD